MNYNPGHNILELYKFDSPQVKRTLKSRIANLTHELPNDLRLRKLGNITKISNLVDTA